MKPTSPLSIQTNWEMDFRLRFGEGEHQSGGKLLLVRTVKADLAIRFVVEHQLFKQLLLYEIQMEPMIPM